MSSTNFIDKQTLIEASWLNDVDAAVYEGTGVYTPAGTGAVARTTQDKLRESVSVLDFGADPTGAVDSSAAFSAAWAYLKSTYDVTLGYVTVSLVVPTGKYFMDESINWAGGASTVLAWNAIIQMRGAVLIAGPGCAGVAVIDATAVRGLHIEGGYIGSSQTVLTAPLCGVLIGPKDNMTCGNNSFVSLNIWGTYTLAPFVNIGSETTNYYGCYFGQLSTDPAAYAYVGDGYNAKGAMITSLYTSLRGVNDAVSFTNNKFYGCHFRNEGVGSSVFLSCTNNWEMDPC